ncbi:MAG: hypothetical protein ACOYM7_10900 [Paludibacter sp.]
MSKLLIIVGFLITCNLAIQAQNKNVLTQPSSNPVLLADTHAESMSQATKLLASKSISVLEIVTDLTTKQSKSILKIEACRDKKRAKIEKDITKLKKELAMMKSEGKVDATEIAKVNTEISKLAISFQKTNRKAVDMICTKLTDKQRETLSCFK